MLVFIFLVLTALMALALYGLRHIRQRHVMVLPYAKRRELWHQYLDRKHILHRLSGIFILGGAVLGGLFLFYFLMLEWQMPEVPDYARILSAGQAETGVVTAVDTVPASCWGRPSVCAQSVSVADQAGRPLLDEYWLQRGLMLETGDQVRVMSLSDQARVIDRYPPFVLDDDIVASMLVGVGLGFLFLFLGVSIRAAFFYICQPGQTDT